MSSAVRYELKSQSSKLFDFANKELTTVSGQMEPLYVELTHKIIT